MLHLCQGKLKFLHPQGRTLTDGGRLGGLEVGESQCGHCLIFIREGSKLCQNVDQLFADQLKCLTHDDDIRIIADIAACRAQMDDALCLRALQTIGIDMAHDIMTDHFFTRAGFFIINILRMRFQFRDLFVGDRDPEFLLDLRQCDP